MQTETFTLTLADKTVTAEFSDLAEQANGSVIIRCGDTAVLVTAVMEHEAGDAPFFPLTVDYEEKFYAAGQILGSRFQRREGRPTEEAVLAGRVIDRTIRPLFADYIRHPTQIVVTVLSIGEEAPDALGVIGASLALGVSDIPWAGPVGAVRLGAHTDGDHFTVNPTYTQRQSETYRGDLLVCGQRNTINMIEAGTNELTEKEVREGLSEASEYIASIEQWQQDIIASRGRPKRHIEPPHTPQEVTELFESRMKDKLEQAVFSGKPGKESIQAIEEEWKALVREHIEADYHQLAEQYFDTKIDELVHREAIDNDRRPDGRAMDEIRPLTAKAGGISSIHHGTGIFYRGGTHIMSVLTLAAPSESQVVEGMEVQEQKRFMHHYNFPPFSVGETGRMGGMNRRAIGHGALAEKALRPVIPAKEQFPYTIRLVSEALASNGSTSMGSVCGSTLAMMDGGVPITKPVAGIASGLMMDDLTHYKVLTDIQGPEDHHGDMDFKVAGTRDGITAIQMDVKVGGVSHEILAEAFDRAKEARQRILDTIEAEIDAPRAELSPSAPYIRTLTIAPEKIGLVIGPSGKTVTDIRDRTETDIDIEDDGSVFVTGKKDGVEQAVNEIELLTREYEIGQKYHGDVVKLVDFGAFVRLDPNTEALLHISEIAPHRIEKVEDVLSVGQTIPVIIKTRDEQGRLKLSLKDADPYFTKTEQ